MNIEINKIATYAGHKGSVYDLGPTVNGGKFLSASGDGHLVEWESPEVGKPLAKVNNPIYTFENQVGKDRLWLGENTVGLHLINTKERKIMAFLKLEGLSLFSVLSFGKYTFVGSNVGYVHIINNENNSFVQHLPVSKKSIRTIAINEETEELAVGASDWSIKIYDLKSLSLKFTLEGHKNSVFTLVYHKNTLISSGRDAYIRTWEVGQNYQNRDAIPAHNYAINHILPLKGTNLMASCSMDKTIKIWDIDTFKLLKVIEKGKNAGHGTSVNRLFWEDKSQRLFSGSDDRTISEWKLF